MAHDEWAAGTLRLIGQVDCPSLLLHLPNLKHIDKQPTSQQTKESHLGVPGGKSLHYHSKPLVHPHLNKRGEVQEKQLVRSFF
jgi:hypothetical protein